MIDTVLFDFDGTVMDTNNVIISSWQHVYKTLRGEEGDVEYILSTFGEPLEYSMEKTFPEVSVDEAVRIYRKYHVERFLDMIELFPGIRALLEEVNRRGYKTGIATSRVRHTLQKGLDKFELNDYFDAIVAVEDIEKPKPDPETILKALAKLESDPETAVMVGDSRLDILCARNAGVCPVLVGWSATLAGKTIEDFPAEEAPDHIIQKPEDLLGIL